MAQEVIVEAEEMAQELITSADAPRQAGGGNDGGLSSVGPQELQEPIQDRVRGKTERLETFFTRIGTRIHRFPPGLRGIGGPDGRYITPSIVALGPYHHGSRPDLREMEELKHAAAHYFCEASGHQAEEVFDKILSIAEQARCCYDEDAVAHLSHLQFAEMMFLDGCFLLMYIIGNDDDLEYPPLLMNCTVLSTGPCILRDIMLLENQLPWLVIEALLTFKYLDVHFIIIGLMVDFIDVTERPGEVSVMRDYRPTHLLDLVRFYLIASMPEEEILPPDSSGNMALLSAIQLTEMGVKLKASKVAWFADMSIRRNSPFFGELSMSPVFLNDVSASWLVNIAAFEARTSIAWPSDGYLISSYLSLLALLMEKEEDVHELRAHHIVTSLLSNQDTLEFFKAIARHLRLGYRYFAIFHAIEEYKKERRVRIVIHRFLYQNWKIIVTLISVSSVLVGIFRTLYSLKRN